MMNYCLPLVIGGYSAASYYFLKNPLLIHTRKHIRPVRLIAHRGGAAEGFENTLQTYRRAVAMGCEMLELDVQLSKDGKAVVAHDDNLERLTGTSTKISDSCFNDLPRIKSKLAVDFDPGVVYDGSESTPSERMFTTLEDVLKEFKDVQVNIDIKQNNPILIAEVNKIICEQNAQDRCVWGSFSYSTTQQCYSANPSIGLFFSAQRLLLLLVLFYSGILPFVSLKETHLEIPMLSVFLSEKFSSDECNVSFGKLPKPILMMANFLLLRPSLIDHLKARGIPTYLWVLNNPEQFEQARLVGVSGIMTDYPSRLKQYFEENNLM